VESEVKVKENSKRHFLESLYLKADKQTLQGIKMKPISPERQRIAKIFKTHIDRAILELGVDYNVTLQGSFDKTPIRIEIQIDSKSEIP
jgi:hypothetical protein